MTFENSSYIKHEQRNFPKSSNPRELFLVDTPVLGIAIIKFWTLFFCHKKNYSKLCFIEILTHEHD
jgi:hypothetical protein